MKYNFCAKCDTFYKYWVTAELEKIKFCIQSFRGTLHTGSVLKGLNNFDGIVLDIYLSKISVSKEDLNFESLSNNVVSYGLVA